MNVKELAHAIATAAACYSGPFARIQLGGFGAACDFHDALIKMGAEVTRTVYEKAGQVYVIESSELRIASNATLNAQCRSVVREGEAEALNTSRVYNHQDNFRSASVEVKAK